MQHSLFEALSERDKAIQKVSINSGNWIQRARAMLRSVIKPGWEGTGEDIRLELLKAGLPAPHHHNAWGALIKSVVPKHFIPTGKFRHMRTKKSHARQTIVYRKKDEAGSDTI